MSCQTLRPEAETSAAHHSDPADSSLRTETIRGRSCRPPLIELNSERVQAVEINKGGAVLDRRVSLAENRFERSDDLLLNHPHRRCARHDRPITDAQLGAGQRDAEQQQQGREVDPEQDH